MTVLIVGDPHGRFDRLRDACRRYAAPGSIILLGDLGLVRPLADELADELADGWRVRWILGNHDCDSAALYDRVVDSLPDGDLGCQSEDFGGITVGGLGGVYRGQIWYPRIQEDAVARYEARAAYMQQVRLPERWRRGMPLKHRATIFPEDHGALACMKLDVLVSHEAPATSTMGGKGFHAINALLDSTGARCCVHGHHHFSYSEALTLPSGQMCAVRGLAIGEVLELVS